MNLDAARNRWDGPVLQAGTPRDRKLASDRARARGIFLSRKRTVEERFWQKVDVRGLDECWPWQKRNVRGYGRFFLDGHEVTAARIAWEFANGPMQPGLFACHKCDNPPCCNPAHVFPGTALDNARDAMAKGHIANRRRPSACRYGHSYDDPPLHWRGFRRCSVCLENQKARRRVAA